MGKDAKGHGSNSRNAYKPGDKPGRKFKSYEDMAAYRESKEDHQRAAHDASRAVRGMVTPAKKVRATTKNQKY